MRFWFYCVLRVERKSRKRCSMPTEITFSPSDIAARYTCKVGTILQLIARGEIRAINVGLGKHKPRWRITQDSLAAFEASRGSSPPAATRSPSRRRTKTAEYHKYFELNGKQKTA